MLPLCYAAPLVSIRLRRGLAQVHKTGHISALAASQRHLTSQKGATKKPSVKSPNEKSPTG